MNSAKMAGQAIPSISAAQISQVEFGGYTVDSKKLPNKKISFDVHTAHNGYVVRVSQNTFGVEDDMYVINDDQDLGQELGKIITHYTLSKHD